MRTADFDYALPPELIAQHPALRRDESRLLVLDRQTGGVTHRKFPDLLEYLRPGDVLVLNNSRVLPARLRGVNARTGGRFEMLLLEENGPNDWWVMLRPGKRAGVGTQITLTAANPHFPLSSPEGGEGRGLSRRSFSAKADEEALGFRTKIPSPQPSPRSSGEREVEAIAGSLTDGGSKVTAIQAVVTETNEEGHRRLRFSGVKDIAGVLDQLGEVPLPPYITRENAAALQPDKERYQTVYAEPAGSVAAPTAGLHFTGELLDEIRGRGIEVHFVTLHVGLGTFASVKAEELGSHVMHEERFELGEGTARAVNEAKSASRRVVAVGTTTVRVLESVAAQHGGRLSAGAGRTRIFLYPPADFRIVDALLTNFHLPRSTLLMLVSAFASPGGTAGRETVLSAYREAIRERYRFFSYGDAMLML